MVHTNMGQKRKSLGGISEGSGGFCRAGETGNLTGASDSIPDKWGGGSITRGEKGAQSGHDQKSHDSGNIHQANAILAEVQNCKVPMALLAPDVEAFDCVS